MTVAVDLLWVVAPVLYGLAALVAIACFVRPDCRLRAAAMPLLLAAVGAHAALVALAAASARRCPLGTLSEATGFAGLSLAAVYAALELRGGRRPTGILVLPLAFALVLAAALTRREGVPVNPALSSPWFSLHAASAVLGIGALAVSFVHGVLYLLLYREIKARRFGLLFRRLPPLLVLQRMAHTAALIGWALLLVTLVAGTLWSLESDRAARMLRDPLFLVTAGVWGLYTVGLGLRFLGGWRGRTSVLLSVAGFLLLLLSVTAVFVIWPALHEYR
jgi:ABC-type transport system involved in cytochrome c biogenesis permease subunit